MVSVGATECPGAGAVPLGRRVLRRGRPGPRREGRRGGRQHPPLRHPSGRRRARPPRTTTWSSSTRPTSWRTSRRPASAWRWAPGRFSAARPHGPAPGRRAAPPRRRARRRRPARRRPRPDSGPAPPPRRSARRLGRHRRRRADQPSERGPSGPPAGDDARKARAQQAAGHLAGDLDQVLALPRPHVAWVEGRPDALALKVAPIDVGRGCWPPCCGRASDAATACSPAPPSRPGLGERLGLPAGSCATPRRRQPLRLRPTRPSCTAPPICPTPAARSTKRACTTSWPRSSGRPGAGRWRLFTSWRAMRRPPTPLRGPASRGPCSPSRTCPSRRWSPGSPRGRAPACSPPWASGRESTSPDRRCRWSPSTAPLPPTRRPAAPGPAGPPGAGPFGLVDLPRAATLLAQGAGRLIRRPADRGVVAVLDPRLATAGYRWDLVRALPPMRRTRHRRGRASPAAGADAGRRVREQGDWMFMCSRSAVRTASSRMF